MLSQRAPAGLTTVRTIITSIEALLQRPYSRCADVVISPTGGAHIKLEVGAYSQRLAADKPPTAYRTVLAHVLNASINERNNPGICYKLETTNGRLLNDDASPHLALPTDGPIRPDQVRCDVYLQDGRWGNLLFAAGQLATIPPRDIERQLSIFNLLIA